ncbi:hypothetical protein TRVL_05505 [Trypanosoma vivax]|nr:hypothetical protein TRVL_05505 [Trypanosoma vivax]
MRFCCLWLQALTRKMGGCVCRLVKCITTRKGSNSRWVPDALNCQQHHSPHSHTPSLLYPRLLTESYKETLLPKLDVPAPFPPPSQPSLDALSSIIPAIDIIITIC